MIKPFEEEDEQGTLILAAEECPEALFDKLHCFSNYEELLINKLLAHGPILIKGGRGSGKSALLLEAHRRLSHPAPSIFSVYLSLRYLPLLRSTGSDYEEILCELLIKTVTERLSYINFNYDFSPEAKVEDVQRSLVQLTIKLKKRIVLFFDDAAHIGRETSLADFFDILRALSGSTVSCKAAIYPGVTKFGLRFDVYNDTTVLDISRHERNRFFVPFFHDVIKARYPEILERSQIPQEELSLFLGRTVIGNMRAFVFLCNKLSSEDKSLGYNELTDKMIDLSSNYYWPLLEELIPKLGNYEPLIKTAMELAEKLYSLAKKNEATSVLIHRNFIQKLAKPLEILEYAGFISRREASRAMKSGGRGALFALNFCNLLEVIEGKRLTSDRFAKWIRKPVVLAEIHSSNPELRGMHMPELPKDKELSILSLPLASLVKSKAYPYGLTDEKIEILNNKGMTTIGELAGTPDSDLLSLPSVGYKFLKRIRDVTGQAIWM